MFVSVKGNRRPACDNDHEESGGLGSGDLEGAVGGSEYPQHRLGASMGTFRQQTLPDRVARIEHRDRIKEKVRIREEQEQRVREKQVLLEEQQER